MRIGVHRHFDGRMTKTFRNDFRMFPELKHNRCVSVAQIMKSNSSYSGFFNHLGEVIINIIRIQWLSF